ncbi:MAG: polysaccharide deacetylase family protein [Stellaceae bacterium]
MTSTSEVAGAQYRHSFHHRRTAPLFPEPTSAETELFRSGPPRLLVSVDTEEAFDWSKPYDRSAIDVDHIRHLDRAQRIFERYGVRPLYLVDYPVAAQERGHRPLREWLADGRCAVGAHLHHWVNPPFEEEVSVWNSYPGNLDPALERAKLTRLVETIEASFGQRPLIYRAGRYGIGPATGAILEELGFAIDSSVVPRTDFSPGLGPDFRDFSTDFFRFGPSESILEVPLTVGWHGRLKHLGPRLQPLSQQALAMRLHVPGILARTGLLERIRLTPEGNSFRELKRLTRSLLAAGVRFFNLTYHSPSLEAGNTPYVRNDAELAALLSVIARYCDYFFGECGGAACTLEEI